MKMNFITNKKLQYKQKKLLQGAGSSSAGTRRTSKNWERAEAHGNKPAFNKKHSLAANSGSN